MGILDSWLVYRFIRILVTPWDETDAFKLGIIDASGHPLKKSNDLTTDAQKNAFSLFYRLIFNIKRLVEKIPGGKSKIGTYAAALFLLREQLGDEEGVLVFERSIMTYLKEHNAVDPEYLTEQYLPEENLPQGNFKTINNMLDQNGDMLQKGTILVAQHETKPIARVLGVDVFKLQVAKTGKAVIVSNEDISAL